MRYLYRRQSKMTAADSRTAVNSALTPSVHRGMDWTPLYQLAQGSGSRELGRGGGSVIEVIGSCDGCL